MPNKEEVALVPKKRSGRRLERLGRREAPAVWERRASFGQSLRGWREALGLSLRRAAADLSVSYSYLSRLETGDRTPPSLAVLQRIADLYGLDLSDVMKEAGYHAGGLALDPGATALRDRFARLVLHPDLRPAGMDELVIDCVGPLVMMGWIEFALRLEAAVRASAGLSVQGLLAEPVGASGRSSTLIP